MSPTRVVHITPELPPTVGGVADYTAILSRRLVEESNEVVEPVLVRAGQESDPAPDVEFPVIDLGGGATAPALTNTISQLSNEAPSRTLVLLQYSGYGFSTHGAPLWLLRGLRQSCGERGIPLLTVFHEIRSFSWKPWTRTFWLSPVQTGVAWGIARLCDGVMTTHPTAAARLRRFASDTTPVHVAPVFSNVGEPAERRPYEKRRPRAVVFGGGHTKTAIYETHGPLVKKLLQHQAIDEVVDVGAAAPVGPDHLGTEARVLGVQPAETISALLLDARIGLLHYSAAYATKSGVLAAYMAHGAAPALVDPAPRGGMLDAHKHYVPVRDGTEPPIDGYDRVSQQARNWYDQHAHSRRAATTMLGMLTHVFSS